MFKSIQKRKKEQKRTVTFAKSKTQQSHKDGCDINRLVRLYSTGAIKMDPLSPDDFRESGDMTYHEAHNFVKQIEEKFEELPAKVRAEFQNDPSEFHKFIQNPENLERITDQGVLSEHDLKVKKHEVKRRKNARKNETKGEEKETETAE